MAVVNFELVAIQLQQARPTETFWDRGRRSAQARLLVRHFQEQKKRQLLDVIAVGKTIIPKNVAVVPELLDQLGRHYFTIDVEPWIAAALWIALIWRLAFPRSVSSE